MRWLEMQFQSFLQVRESFLFGFSLACDIELEALGNIQVSFLPDGRREWALHELIVSYDNLSGSHRESV